MEIITSSPGVNTAVALGAFDGLHKGHLALIKTIIESNYKSCIFTFTQSKAEYITSNEQRIEIFEELGIDFCFFQDFDEQFKCLEPEAFVKQYLYNFLCAKKVVVGYNYHFGMGGKGDAELLTKICASYDMDIVVIPQVMYLNEGISSTRIREAIANGNIKDANAMLGRHYTICGTVIEGERIGRILGFPTANIMPDSARIMPKKAVYATTAIIDGRKYKAVTNYGGKPTIHNGVCMLETHIIGYDGDIYGREIEVQFIDYIREIVAFKNVDELKAQIEKDTIFRESITF